MKKLNLIFLNLSLMLTLACKKTTESALTKEKNVLENTTAAKEDKDIQLLYKLDLTSSYPLKLRNIQKITQTVNKKKEIIKQSTSYELLFTPKEEKPDRYICQMQYKNIHTEASNGKDTFIVNTADKKPDDQRGLFWDMMKTIIGKNLQVELAKNGEILNLKGFDQIYTAIKKELIAKKMPSQTVEGMISMLRQNFSEQAFKKTYEQLPLRFPSEKITVGKSWQEKIDSAQGEEKKSGVKNYTLTSVKDNTAQIKVEVTIDEISSSTKNAQGSEHFSLSGSQKGEVNIDLKSGWLKEAKITQDMKGSIKANYGKEHLTVPISVNGELSGKGL